MFLLSVPRARTVEALPRLQQAGSPDLVPRQYGDSACVLVARVLPMGFLNSVSIAQHVHRNVVKWASMAGILHDWK